jgi:hypothetical protein
VAIPVDKEPEFSQGKQDGQDTSPSNQEQETGYRMKDRSGPYIPDLKSLLFIYNHDSSMLQEIKDYTASTPAAPRADDCTLCAITHTPVGMKKEWKRYLRHLKIPSRFLNRNEFFSEFGCFQTTFPVILLQKGKELAVLIRSEELDRCGTLNDIITLIEQHLQFATGATRVISRS